MNKTTFATHRHGDRLQCSPSADCDKAKSDNVIETNMALKMTSKKVCDYRDELYNENRNFTVEALREKCLNKKEPNIQNLAFSDPTL